MGPVLRLPRDVLAMIDLDDDQLARLDVARVNLSCALGLPGSESLDISECIRTLDRWADMCKRYIRDCKRDGTINPSNAPFDTFNCIVTLIKHPRAIGCTYQPSAINNLIFKDARDDFLHGLLTRKLGTCASFPVLLCAIARRLGYPLYLALSAGHIFNQWVTPKRRLNLEGTGPAGATNQSDDHYRHFPRSMTIEDEESGIHLRPLAPREEFALFLETRGHFLTDNGRYDEAESAYRAAHEVAPNWYTIPMHLRELDLRRLRADPDRSFAYNNLSSHRLLHSTSRVTLALKL